MWIAQALVAAMVMAGGLSELARGQVPWVRIAKTGDPVPEIPSAEHWVVGSPAIDAAGNIALRGGIRGPGIDGRNNEVLFYGWPGNLGMILRETDPLRQFGEGVQNDGFTLPQMAQTGEIGYTVYLDGPGIDGTNDWTLWAGAPSHPTLVAWEGEVPPDVSDGRVYGGAFVASLGRAGHVAFTMGLVEPGQQIPDQYGLWAGRPDDPRLVARTGAQAPGTEPGVHFSSSILTPGFTVNRRGAVAFPASIDGPGVDPSNSAGIWAGTHEDLGLVVRAGDPAPVPEPGVRFVGRPQYAIINGNDRVMFPSFLTGEGIDASNDYGLWAGNTSGELELIAREGDEVPLLGPDYRITNIYPYIQTEDDRIAVVETFDGPAVTPDDDQAILFGRPGDWDLLFREAEQAPGLPDGVVLNFNERVPKIAILESGASGMILDLAGEGVTPENDRALFWRRSGEDPWLLVAREGDLFDGSVVSDGGLFIWPNGGGGGAIPSINDRGDLAFWIIFDDPFPDSVFGAYLVPEPNTLVGLLLAIVLLNSKRTKTVGRSTVNSFSSFDL